jgi:hypothetical protein
MFVTRDALAGSKATAALSTVASEESQADQPIPFTCEADMLVPLAVRREQFAQGERGWETFFEVQTTHGVVDILFVAPDLTVLNLRAQSGLPPVEDVAGVATLLALTAGGHVRRSDLSRADEPHLAASSRDLVSRVPVTHSHLRRHVLPQLVEAGWATLTGHDRWLATMRYAIPMRRIVAVEVKRAEWRRALTQAAPHTAFADSTFVALDAARLPDLQVVAPAFTFAGVGLAGVAAHEDHGSVQVLVASGQHRSTGLPRAVVAERVAGLRAAGLRSGPVAHVFGRVLTASVDLDPRLGPSSTQAFGP